MKRRVLVRGRRDSLGRMARRRGRDLTLSSYGWRNEEGECAMEDETGATEDG